MAFYGVQLGKSRIHFKFMSMISVLFAYHPNLHSIDLNGLVLIKTSSTIMGFVPNEGEATDNIALH